MSNNKKKIENTLTAVGIAALVSGATFGLFYYLRSGQQTHENNSSDKKKPKSSQIFKGDLCPICFDFLTTKYTTIKCQHTFHKKCIAQWQAINNTCPICRKKFDNAI
ncbi:E3 ubiquitin-protein ligase RNF139-like [Tribolium madens]|uniref:E3 ubiquitin-protein ligase RNF139-like n=1 Tax=Tribolium madens TaxID=41895 RepID=UPI001CF71D27|nr:E3 ubiquitin-protein ligase RNF139-like [Tribolium madens]